MTQTPSKKREFDVGALKAVKRGSAVWNTWLGEVPDRPINLRGADLSGLELHNLNLVGADLVGANLQGSDFTGSDFTRANLTSARVARAKLVGCNLSGAILKDANLLAADLTKASLVEAHADGAVLTEALLSHANCRKARFDDCEMHRTTIGWADFGEASLRGAELTGVSAVEIRFVGADLRGALLDQASLHRADFTRADLRKTRLDGSNLTMVTFREARFGPGTQLRLAEFETDKHNIGHDESDTVRLSVYDRWASWGRLRGVGALPLFEVSYLGLTAAIVLVTAIGYLNETQTLQQLSYPIPLPNRTLLLLGSSLFLVLGTTLYRIRCPNRIQEMSETAWVEQYSHPRLLYLAQSLRHPVTRGVTAFFTLLGGVGAAWLLVDRLIVAGRYVIRGVWG